MTKQISSRMDISNQKYNELTALRFHKTDKHGNSIWECLCDCGKTSYVRLGALRAGQIKQCKKCGDEEKVKYDIKTPRLKSIYMDMKRRCYDSTREDFHRYGGRGIEICQNWLENPQSFEKWSLENGYSEELSIDRINNDGNYEPSNCRWTNHFVQANNRSNNNVLEYKGVSLTITQWAERLGVDRTTMYNRLKNEEDVDIIFSTVDIRQQKSKSGIKGVIWNKTHKRWQVRTLENKKRISIGTYKTLENAVYAKEAYDLSGIKLTEAEIERQMNRK